MEIKKLPIKSIVSNTGQIPDVPANPRFIKDEKFALLVQSLKDTPEMMEGRPLWVFPYNGEFIAIGGNMRHKAAKELKWKEINCCILPEDSTPEKLREIIIKDNVAYGSNDWDMLANEWDSEELEAWGMDLPETFAAEELEAVEDDYTEPDQMQVDVVLGDLIEIGEHRLLCGDSTDVGQVERLMGGEKADMVFTSPPYNQGGGGMKYDYNGDVKKLYQQNTDQKTEKEYFDFCITILNVIKLIVKNNGAIFWNISYNANARADYGKIIFSELNPFDVYETIIWDKGHAFPTASKGILSRTCELVFLLCSEKYYTNQGENEPMYNVWRISSSGSQNEIHKACFPIGLPSEGIKLCSKENNIIYEPFTGSGSTMVAAHQLKRRCFGMELDPKYCQVIIDRMQKLDPSLEVKINGKPYKKDVPF